VVAADALIEITLLSILVNVLPVLDRATLTNNLFYLLAVYVPLALYNKVLLLLLVIALRTKFVLLIVPSKLPCVIPKQ